MVAGQIQPATGLELDSGSPAPVRGAGAAAGWLPPTSRAGRCTMRPSSDTCSGLGPGKGHSWRFWQLPARLPVQVALAWLRPRHPPRPLSLMGCTRALALCLRSQKSACRPWCATAQSAMGRYCGGRSRKKRMRACCVQAQCAGPQSKPRPAHSRAAAAPTARYPPTAR